MFTSNYNTSKLIFMMTKTLIWNFPIFFVQPVFMSLYLFLPPLPRLSYHFIPTFFCSKTFKQCFLWIKYTNAKDMPYPLGPKQVLNTLLQRKSTRSAFAEKECLCDVSPMIIQGAWTGPMPGQPEDNLLKSFSQTIYLQLCISIIHW